MAGPLNVHAEFSQAGSDAQGAFWSNPTDVAYAGWKLRLPSGLSGTLTGPDGTVLHFDSAGALYALRDRFNQGVDLTRDSGQRITRIGNTRNSYRISLTYNTAGRVESATDFPRGRTARYSYHPSGALAQVTDVAGGATLYSWSPRAVGADTLYNLDSVRDPRGVVVLANSHDTSGRVVRQTEGNGGATTFQYLPGPGGLQQTRVTDANNNVVLYDLQSRVATGYLVTAVTGPTNRTTQFGYASTGVPFLQSVTDFRNRTVSLTHDSRGNVLSVTRPTLSGGTVTSSATYDAQWDELTSATDELGKTTTVTLDPNTGLPTTVAAPWGAAASASYNAFGQVLTATSPANGTSSFAYNSAGLPTTLTNALQQASVIGYDGQEQPRTLTDPLQRVVTLTQTPFSRLASVAGPQSSGYGLTYDGANLTTQLDAAGGARHRWSHDGSGDTVSGTDPAGGTETVTRDGNGNPLVVTDRMGRKTEYVYGPGDRLETVRYRNAAGLIESTVTYTYSSTTDLLTGISDSAAPGSYSFQYNSLDQVTAITGPEGVTSFSYDNLGRLTSAQAPGQSPVTYTYDSFGRLESVTQGTATLTYGWDNITDRLATVTRPNGVQTRYTYDLLERVTGIEHWLGSTLLESESYTFDAAGRVTGRTRNGATSTFTHDDLDQLTGYSVPGESAQLGYDLAGNRTSESLNGGAAKPLLYGPADRLASDGGLPVAHDLAGSIVQYGTAHFRWDTRGRLVEVRDGGSVATFQYDCWSRRVAKTVNGVTTRYRYLGSDLAVETDAGGTVTATYFYEPGVDRPISRTTSAGTVYYLQDHAGSVTALARPDGSIIGRYHYAPFGKLLAADPGMPSQPLLWTARERDETGLYYLRGRYYHPGIGRFLSEDPAGLAAGLNLYAFALNSPVGMRDPFGLDASNMDDGFGNLTNFFAGWGDKLSVVACGPVGTVYFAANGMARHILPPPPEMRPYFPASGAELCRTIYGVNGQVDQTSPYYAAGERVGDVHLSAMVAAGGAGGGPRSSVAGSSPNPPGTPVASGVDYVVTPNGVAVKIPAGYVGRVAQDGRGLVYQPAGATTPNSNAIRVAGPNDRYPNGYARYYNEHGQPIVPATGKPGSNAETHIPF